MATAPSPLFLSVSVHFQGPTVFKFKHVDFFCFRSVIKKDKKATHAFSSLEEVKENSLHLLSHSQWKKSTGSTIHI